MHEASGNASLWSDRRPTSVLPFNCSDRKMRAYMANMGIDIIPEKTLSAWNISFSPRHFTYRSKNYSAHKL
jgi:hypothetical protein